MRVRRQRCRLVASIAAVAWMVAQFLVAAHACPRALGHNDLQHADAGVHAHCTEALPDSAAQDDDLVGSALCQEHCNGQPAQQAPDLATPVALEPPERPIFLVLAPEASDPRERASVARERQRERPRPPSHCISHCVWRV